jgi:hypothetical protein
MPWIKEELNEENYDLCPTSQFNWWTLHTNLSEDFMRRFGDKLNWRKVSDHQKGLTESFIRENADRVHWDRICQRIQMSVDFIEEFQDKVIWDYIWSYQKKLPTDFIERHTKGQHGRVDWSRIVMYQKLDDRFIWNHLDDLSISLILDYQKPRKELFDKLFEYCMIHYQDKQLHGLERRFLYQKCKRFQMTEKEIERYIELKTQENWGGNGWCTILQYQQLSEDFIEKHYKEIMQTDNFYIWDYQRLSEAFLKRHENDLSKRAWSKIKNNKKIKKTEWINSKIK